MGVWLVWSEHDQNVHSCCEAKGLEDWTSDTSRDALASKSCSS